MTKDQEQGHANGMSVTFGLISRLRVDPTQFLKSDVDEWQAANQITAHRQHINDGSPLTRLGDGPHSGFQQVNDHPDEIQTHRDAHHAVQAMDPTGVVAGGQQIQLADGQGFRQHNRNGHEYQ